MTSAATPVRELATSAGYFGPNRDLFGWFHAGAAPRRDLAVVVGPPTGYEGVQAYRSMRHLAERLARLGFWTLRFDYHGTGDSAGDDRDPDRVAAWQSSVVSAVEHARQWAGTDRVALVGTRLGATLAWMASGEVSIAELVLWEPCVNGRAYVREMEMLASASLKGLTETGADAPGDDVLEAAGFVLTRNTRDDLLAVEMDAVRPIGDPGVLVIGRSDRKENRAVADLIAAKGIAVEYAHLPGLKEMLVPPAFSIVPGDVFSRVERRFMDLSTPTTIAPGTNGPDDCMRCHAVSSDTRLVERPVRFGPDHRLFGVRTSRADAEGAEPPGIVLVPGGAVTRIAANRMYVTLARRLAREGSSVLRMDVAGMGESWTADGAENDPFPPELIDNVEAAVHLMQAAGSGARVLVIGLCSGALGAFAAALRGRQAMDVVLINPLVFYWRPGADTAAPSAQHFVAVARNRRNLLRPSAWPALLKKVITRLVSLQGIRGLLGRVVAMFRPRFQTGADDLGADLTRLVTGGVKTAFVFSDGDPGVDSTVLQGGATLKMLRQRRDIAWQVFQATDHTFSPMRAREALLEWLTTHVETSTRTIPVPSAVRPSIDPARSAVRGTTPE